MNRKGWILALIIWLAAVSWTGTCSASVNLLQNAGFENKSEAWAADSWISGKEATRFAVEHGEGARSGSFFLLIESTVPNDAKWVQSVSVKPDTLYRLSGWIKAEQIPEGMKGANLSVLGTIETSADFRDTQGQWEHVELYGRTGPEQQKLEVALRLGGYGSLNTGRVYFDDVAFEEVEGLPAGAEPVSFAPAETQLDTDGGPDAGNAKVSLFSPLVYALLFFLGFAVLYHWRIRQEWRLSGQSSGGAAEWVALLLSSALLLRLWIAVKVHGHPGDMATFAYWARDAVEAGLTGFYDQTTFADYPPGYIYILYLLGKGQEWLGLSASSTALAVWMKLPAILADLAASLLVYRMAFARMSRPAAVGLAALYAFNPAVLVNSAAWGQVDSFFTFFLVLAVLQVQGRKMTAASVWFALAVLIKPQALIFTPVLLLGFARERSWRQLGTGFVAGAAVFIAGVLPFALHKPLLWVFKLYLETLQSYPYATLNAFNLFALTGGNWVSQEQKLLFLSYQTWGWLFIVAVTIFTAFLFFKRKKGKEPDYCLMALVLISVVFVLGVKMHERYLFPALLLALLSFIQSGDRRVLHLFVGFSITSYVNVSYVLAHGLEHMYAVGRFDGLLLLTSLANVLLLALLIKTAWDRFVNGKVRPVYDPDEEAVWMRRAEEASQEQHGSVRNRWKRKDWILISFLTVIYAAVALFQLGSFRAPEQSWKPSRDGEAVIVDFGDERLIDRTNAFGGIGDGRFRLEFAAENGDWGEPKTVDMNYVKVFTWTSVPVDVKARYARITAERSGFELKELAFFVKDAAEPLPVRSIRTEGGAVEEAARHLFDEPNAAVYHPTFLHGTYFDEIYHARAAYEHLESIKPYENTHPPLGKELIAAGVAVFGMNPFGWRIVGTLFGIAMIPIIYVFAFRMFGATRYAFIASFLFACDFMHFAQTRIATIDVYGVFFIMLMYYFMYRYYQMNMYRDGLRKTLVPLFWSGLFFGIGAASKWIVIYGGVGLAFLFFLTLYERYREYSAVRRNKAEVSNLNAAASADSAGSGASAAEVLAFPRMALASVLWCSLFFVILPLIIYSLSFVPIMMTAGEEVSLAKLIQYQKDMFDYHSQLVAEHSFSSPWWEWPFMARPIWYYSGQSLLPEGQISSIVSMGNPAIWWLGTLAVLAVIVWLFKNRHRGMLVAVTAFLSQYIPWMLVPRLTFIYHFFAMVPFLILCLTFIFKKGIEARPQMKIPIYAYLGLCLVLFAMFYPILSGMIISKEYAGLLKWFPSWYFYS